MLCGGGGPHQTLVSCQVPCHVTRPGWMDGWMETGTGLHDTLVFITYCSQSVLLSIMILFLSHHFPTKINNCLFYYLDDSLINQLEKLEAAKAALSVPSLTCLILDFTWTYWALPVLYRPY